jgi:hypothetical protein
VAQYNFVATHEMVCEIVSGPMKVTKPVLDASKEAHKAFAAAVNGFL